ncbi:MAG: hypothetical protein WCI05_17300, partial [Myxococcales bacterium]
FYFQRGITFSYTGFYAPNFRSSSGAIFDVGGSSCFDFGYTTDELLPLMANKVVRFAAKNFIDQTVNFQVDEFKDLPLIVVDRKTSQDLSHLTNTIICKQKDSPRYDYASNEQLEIDRLVYASVSSHIATLDNRYGEARDATATFCAAHRKLEEGAAAGPLSKDKYYTEILDAVKAARRAEKPADKK